MVSIVPLPEKIRVTDITCTDGILNSAVFIPAAARKRILSALAASGMRRIEVAGYGMPGSGAQEEDTGVLLRHMRAIHPETEAVCRVSSRYDADRAFADGAGHISFVISASPSHNKVHVDKSHEESLADLADIADDHPDIPITLSIPAAFGCPVEGEVPVQKVLWLMAEGFSRGAAAATLCDTIGAANPLQVKVMLENVREEYPDADVGAHLYDTFGVGMANAMAALESGIDRLETAAGGLGGAAPTVGAAVNIPTEDLINMLHRMGIKTGVDLDSYLKAVSMVREYISLPLPGHGVSVKKYSGRSFFSLARM